MARSTLAALLAVPAALALATAPSYAAAGVPLKAHVDSAESVGAALTLTHHGGEAGHITIKRCANTSATEFRCTGSGTIMAVGPAHVRIRWSCPTDGDCAGKGEGTFTNRGNTIALLHVKASPVELTTEGASFKVRVEMVGE